MHQLARWLPVAVSVLLSAVMLAGASPAFAQAAPAVYRVFPASVPSPYWGYVYNPYAAVLHGAADLTRAQGEFLVNKEQAALLHQQARQEKVRSRRAELEQLLWEVDFKVEITKKRREASQEREAHRVRHTEHLTEIWSAYALNVLLDDLRRYPDLSAGLSEPIDPEWLAHLNVTSGKGGAHLGVLRTGKLSWPLILNQPQFAEQRQRIERLVATALQQTMSEAKGTEALSDLTRTVSNLDRQVRRAVNENRGDPVWEFYSYANGLNFLRQLDSALKQLEEPEAVFYLRPPQGRTVAELVGYMNQKGLRFAPASRGGERHYTALYRALAAEAVRAETLRKQGGPR